MLKLLEVATEIVPVPAENTTQEINKDAIKNAIKTATNDLIKNTWNLISEIDGLNATLDFDYSEDNKDDVKNILNTFTDDLTIDIGMLHKVISLIDGETTDLLDAGQDKAEGIIQNDAVEEVDTESNESEQETAAEDSESEE